MDKKKIAHPLSKLQNPEIPFLKKLEWFGIKPGLERINNLLNLIGNPEKQFPSIIVGGTNGKGSVASILHSLLIHNGYRAGLYTSPHLVSICERFRTEKGLITPEEFIYIANKIIKKAGEDELIKMGVTYFEFTTALAFKWFADNKIDIAVLEVGMGGRLDATNSAPAVLSIITSVSKDHTQFLGKTIREIVIEKAGIIKENSYCVTQCTGTALKVIKEQAMKKCSKVIISKKDFYYTKNDWKNFDYRGLKWHLKNLSLNLIGTHQISNAATALAATEVLENCGFSFDSKKIKIALKNITLHARFELMRKNPYVVIDGAHNPSAIKTFVTTLREVYPGKKIHTIFGAMKDKDIKGMLKILEKTSRDFYIAGIPVERAEKPEKIIQLLSKGASAQCFENVLPAYKSAISRAKKNDVICITGSFYLVGEFLKR